jgi:hypothetical protein
MANNPQQQVEYERGLTDEILRLREQLRNAISVAEDLKAEYERYKRCLYRANGRLIQMDQEPEKLDYPIVGGGTVNA